MTYLFIDANVMLHYRRIEEIDWGTLSNSKEVTIVLCPVVVRELDNLKVNHPQKRLRKRAQEIVSSLHAWLSDSDSSSIRQGVWLEFLHNDPDLDFHMHGLRKEISDDWLIASSMVWKQQHPKDDTKIVSADLGVAIKARAKEILVLTPSDGDKLPEEVDEDKKQINELQKELAGIKNTLPVLSLGFWECPDKEFVRFGIKNPFPYDPQASAGEMEHLRSIYQLLTPSNTSPRRRPREIEKLMQSLDPASAFRVTKEGAEQYNSDLTEYFQKYEEYLRKAHDHQNKECLKFDFEIGLHNDGGSPAEDVDIHLDFPDGFELFDGRHHVFKAPDKPEPPKRPG